MNRNVMLVFAVLAASSLVAQVAPPLDRFKPLGPDKGQAGTGDSLFSPADFEAAAATRTTML